MEMRKYRCGDIIGKLKRCSDPDSSKPDCANPPEVPVPDSGALCSDCLLRQLNDEGLLKRR